MMRGIPRIAVDKNLPVYGTNYTAKDVADLDHVCKWNPDNYGLNQSHPARRPGMTRSSTCSPPGASTSSRSTTCRSRSTPTKSPPIIAPSPKPKPNTAVRLTCLSRPALGGDELRRLPARERPNVAYFRRSVGPLGRHLPAVRPLGPLGAVPDHRPLGRRRHGAVRAHRPARRTRRRPPIPPYAGRAEDTAGPMVHGA